METLEERIHFKTQARFTGEPGNPLLAPRGVFLHGNLLVVSDTGQNRVFIWNRFMPGNEQAADVVLGQESPAHTGRNADDQVSASSLQYPSGIWTNGQLLMVADAWNHRVLIWKQIPSRHNQPADVVVGQKDFCSNQPNVEGLGKPCSAQSLYWPYGVWSDGVQMWIADTGNRRVLYYKDIPSSSFAAADEVIGQPAFTERDFDPANAVWPYSVKISAEGAMLITDTQFYRVLFWKHWKRSLSGKADSILGQPDLAAAGQNQYQLKPAANTLNWCYDSCFYMNGLAIADSGNSRILIHESIPTVNNSVATGLIGQTDFDINGESSLSLTTSRTHEMYWPFAVNTWQDLLVVADTGNHRILIYKEEK